MEFLLNSAGLRFDFGKTQGLFNKIARPKGYLLIWTVGSRSDDLDTYQLRWSDLTRTRPATGRSPGIGFRGGASPELGNLGAPGIKTTRTWV
jgi:hypothetical protein